MNTLETTKLIFSKKIICQLFGHKIVTTKNVTKNIKEYKCIICNLELTNLEDDHQTYLSPELRDINETILKFRRKK